LNDTVALVFIIFLYLLIAAVIIRALLSWFPNVDPRGQLVRMLHNVTEPLLDPVRRIMPRTGFIDLSAMIVILVLYVMIEVVRRAADA
jgi:YggT family protein